MHALYRLLAHHDKQTQPRQRRFSLRETMSVTHQRRRSLALYNVPINVARRYLARGESREGERSVSLEVVIKPDWKITGDVRALGNAHTARLSPDLHSR